MSECLHHLDTVLHMADDELAALSAGDLDTAETLCADREALTCTAMDMTDSAPGPELVQRLTALQQVQNQLYSEAYRRREEIRVQLGRSKQETRRLNGYRKAVNMGL